jgi:hypothetical protein
MVFPQGGGCQCGSVRYEISGERMLRIYFLQQWFNLSDPAWRRRFATQSVGIIHDADECHAP